MAIVKSKLLKQLSQNYPNFLKKDLEKFTEIILKEIKITLRRGERVELRGFGVFSTNSQSNRSVHFHTNTNRARPLHATRDLEFGRER